MDRLVILVPAIMQAAFFFALGASVGSFVNVIAWRWPRGQGIVHPASRCGACGRSLVWWENIPIASWFLLRGRCRSCGVVFGMSHVVVECATAMVFAGTVLLLFAGPFTDVLPAQTMWWLRLGAWTSAPTLLAVLTLWGCLLAVALIDAETGFIPLGLTSLALGVGLACMTIQGFFVPDSQATLTNGWPTGVLSPLWIGVGLGALLGSVIAGILLWKGWLPRSFAQVDPIADVPPSIARTEVLKELIFLALPACGAIAGGILLRDTQLPIPLQALGSSGLGMTVGAATIWMTRILGTLAFGREAMGLGDVHLMAAAGAVIGWRDAGLAYLAAPFLALTWVAVSGGLAKFRGKTARELPYGPHLALAVVVVYLGRPWVVPAARILFGIP